VKAHAAAPAKLSLAKVLSTAATASAGIYLQYDGITGAPGHRPSGYAPVNSFQFGIGRAVTHGPGGGTASLPNVSEITLTKSFDKYSLPLTQDSLFGNGTPNAVLYFTSLGAGGTELNTYLEIDLENVFVSGYSISSGGDRPSESVTLNFSKITLKSKVSGSPVEICYDLANSTSCNP
jgi:type VI secretion system secreted protein Hcp